MGRETPLGCGGGEGGGEKAQARGRRGQEEEPEGRHGCQLAIARFPYRMCLALRASGLWLRYAMLQNLIASFPWIAPPCPPPWRNPRKGRDQILPSGNIEGRPLRDGREWPLQVGGPEAGEGRRLRAGPQCGAAEHNQGDGGLQVCDVGHDPGGHDPGGGRATHQGRGKCYVSPG